MGKFTRVCVSCGERQREIASLKEQLLRAEEGWEAARRMWDDAGGRCAAAEEQVEGLRGLLDRFSSAVDLLQGSLPSDQEYVPEVRAGLDEVIAALAEPVTGADELPPAPEPEDFLKAWNRTNPPECAKCGGSGEVQDFRWDEDTELSRYCGMKPCACRKGGSDA